MNRIEAIQAVSKYATAPHTVITIDGVPLDEVLNRLAPDRIDVGLLPTLLDAMYNQVERSIVWSRILPSNGKSLNAPILMCPDDCDLWCTVVIAEVKTENSEVWWKRIGIDSSSPTNMPFSIGTTVDWLTGIGPFCFSRSDYERCIAAFGYPDM